MVAPNADSVQEGHEVQAEEFGQEGQPADDLAVEVDSQPATAFEGVDGVDEDADSTFGDKPGAMSTTSITDSIFQYRELYGRTYHNYGTSTYVAPNDDRQNNMLDIGHHMMTLLLDGKLYLAPIGASPHYVLDIGTGTGIWAMDFADEHPSAVVTGTDLSPIQPQWIPPNLRFEIDDVHLEWTWPEDHFDFIHVRCLMGSIKSWPDLYAKAFRHMRPGGYLEHLEFDIQFTSDDETVKDGDTMFEWSKMFIQVGEDMGQTFKIGQRARELMDQAGFVDLHEIKYKLPVGGWPKDKKWKELGRWNFLFLLEGLDGMQLFILRTILKWEFTEIQALAGKMRSALKDPRNHAYYEVTLVYGKKPEFGPADS